MYLIIFEMKWEMKIKRLKYFYTYFYFHWYLYFVQCFWYTQWTIRYILIFCLIKCGNCHFATYVSIVRHVIASTFIDIRDTKKNHLVLLLASRAKVLPVSTYIKCSVCCWWWPYLYIKIKSTSSSSWFDVVSSIP